MYAFFNYFLYIVAIGFAVLSFYFSARSRRAKDAKQRGLLTARMNISMGFMLTALAAIQLFLFDELGTGSTVRVIVGALFLLIGLFNLFAGIRNHSYFSR